jgi:hypothetical protein
MESVLKEKLWTYMVRNNPDLLLQLQRNNTVSQYLEEKVGSILPMIEQLKSLGNPDYVVEEFCLNTLVEELKPSKYNYLLYVFEEEFPQDFKRISQAGILVYEILMMLEESERVFIDFDFLEETQDNYKLRHAIIVCIHDYLIK